jgi:pimeloyl-ACP methyl ester carboxylesterase
MPGKRNNGYRSGYAPVNGLKMYYEIHGTGSPLVLLHGALSATGTSFGKLLPSLARNRQVVAVEQQAHGHTADINRPLTIRQMADDTVNLLRQFRIEKADLFGYSMGAGIALDIAIQHPDLVRKLVVASVTYNNNGFLPGLLSGMENLKPEDLTGTPWQEEYFRIAPNPEDWPGLVAKVKQLNLHIPDWSAEAVRSIKAPTLIIIGDSDIISPEHAVKMFRLLGGGVAGELAGLQYSRLAILPGTTHVTLMERTNWLLSMVEEFLDSPMPKTSD